MLLIKPSRIKGICFDLDQTLCNSEDYMYRLSDAEVESPDRTAEWQVYQFLKPYLKVITWKHFIKVYLKSREEVRDSIPEKAASHSRYLYIQTTLENFNMRFRPNLVYQATGVYWDYIIGTMSLFPGVKHVLKILKQNHLKICIISDLTADIQNLKLISLDIDNYIDYLVTSEEVGHDKPNTKQLYTALRKMGLKKEQVVIVGNNPKTDILLATKAGVHSILFDYNKEYTDKQKQGGAIYYINDFSKVLEVLDIRKRNYSEEKLVVFDMIGTLTTEPHLVSVILKKLLPAKDIKEVKKYYELYKVDKISRQEFWKNIGVDDFEDIEKKMLEEIKPRAMIFDILENLKKDFNLAILSNIPKEWGTDIRKKLELDNYFEEIVFSGEYGMKKPHPEIYKCLLKKFSRINPENVFFIDDNLDDLQSGKNLLMQTIWLKIEQMEQNFIPDYVIDKIEDLTDLLLTS